jgi:hypothetical protein
MATADQGFNGFRARHNISGQMAQLLGAGLVAMAVLVAAVIAIPVRGSKTASTQAGSFTPSGQEANGGAASSPGSVPSAASVAASKAGATASGSHGPSSFTSANTTTGVSSFGTAPSKFVAARAPGITKDTVYFGFGYSSQAAAGDRAIGAAGAAPSYDTRNVFNATIDYANKHGGFAGRKLKGLYYDYNLTTDNDTQDQSACAYWTQDNKVFAMDGGKTDILKSCANKAGAISLTAGAATSTTYKKFPNLIATDEIAFDRLGFVTVSGLKKAGYFAGKLGFVTWDDPQYKLTWTRGYEPAFKKFNVRVDQTAFIMVPQQIGALGDMTAAVSSAIAKFKSLGIDHVIIQDGPAGVWAGTGLTFEWMNQAKSQNYYPRYGQNTYNSPGWDVLPADQMNNALAIDQSDYTIKFDEGWKVNKFREDCFKIQSDAGYPPSRSNLNDQAIAGATCDIVFMLQRVINSLPMITVSRFVDAVQHLGTSMPSAIVYGTKLFPGRRDGGNMVRTSQYFQSCRCLKFKGKPYYSD